MANNINFSGLGSGIDFNIVRDAIINQKSRPIAQLQSKVNNFNGRIESLKKLNGLLAALTTAAENLTKRDVGTGRVASAGDAAIVSATANAAANPGILNLEVTRLATNLTQASRSYASTNAAVLAGGAASATFELRLGGANSGVEVTIDSTNNTLAGLRDAINGKNAGVTASIVDLKGDGTDQQLVLTSTATGASGRVELVETSATGTGAGLNLRSLNPPDNDFSRLDAAFSINGLNLTRTTNNVSNAVSGVNLTLKKVGATAIDIAPSNEVEEKLEAFVTAYNAVQDFVAEQYKKDGQNRPTGILVGDPALRNAQRQVNSLTGIRAENNGGALESLSQIGVAISKTGKLELNKETLGERLRENADDVRALLFGKTAAESGIFQSAHAVSKDLSDNITGNVQTAINGYQSSIENINGIIANQSRVLNQLRDSLTRRFAAADAAISQLNGQGSALNNVIKSLQPKDS